MNEYIAFDSHKHYTLMEREDAATGHVVQRRIEHRPGAIIKALRGCPRGSAVAVEAMGSWYWIIGEIEKAGLIPVLVHPRKAKLMMGMINKTDKLDVHGLNRLQRNGTLPTVWIAPAELRDLREVTRARMILTQHRTKMKNRLQAILAKHGLAVEGCSDSFGVGAREQWPDLLAQLPPQTQWSAKILWEQLELATRQIDQQEERLKELMEVTPEIALLKTLPGVGLILASVMALEIGDVKRFPDHEHLASYAGTTPRVHSSGDKTRYGRLRPDVNRILKWAFIEAGNSVSLNANRRPDCHVSQLYRRMRYRRGHAKAVGAVARHLAEASYWILVKQEGYRDPALGRAKEGVSAAAACA
ncbi:MAG: IS110 family transposase [Planctomycetaceae bacterium]|nr:IS110 family transposase [Planctomycetaceae bacterium]